MKLFRFGEKGKEKIGLCVADIHYDLSAFGEDYTTDFFASDGINRLEKYFNENKSRLPVIDIAVVRIGMPIANPSKIVCVGLNYTDHVKETGLEQQAEPILFLKAISALTGPSDGITIPKNSHKTDWETELGVVIGRRASYIAEDEVENYIAGYVLHNDISEREFQTEKGGTWDKGKGCDTFAPIGPYIVTPDEIKDVNNLRIWLKLNGVLMQDGNTRDFIRRVPELVSYITQFFSLLPGDIVSTGSPAGAGMGRRPQVFLKNGDMIEYGIESLGSTVQLATDYKK